MSINPIAPLTLPAAKTPFERDLNAALLRLSVGLVENFNRLAVLANENLPVDPEVARPVAQEEAASAAAAALESATTLVTSEAASIRSAYDAHVANLQAQVDALKPPESQPIALRHGWGGDLVASDSLVITHMIHKVVGNTSTPINYLNLENNYEGPFYLLCTDSYIFGFALPASRNVVPFNGTANRVVMWVRDEAGLWYPNGE